MFAKEINGLSWFELSASLKPGNDCAYPRSLTAKAFAQQIDLSDSVTQLQASIGGSHKRSGLCSPKSMSGNSFGMTCIG